MSSSPSTDLATPLPHNPNTERELIGAILLNTSALSEVSKIIAPNDFFVSQHRKIFSAMQTLATRGEPIEIVSLHEELKDDAEIIDAGGAAFIASLMAGLYPKAPTEHWAKLIRDASVLRNLAKMGESLSRAALASHAKTEDVLGYAESLFKSLAVAVKPLREPLVSLSVEELLARDIKPREMLLDPIIPEQGLVLLYSYRGIGKTFLGLGIGLAVASGAGFLRWKAPRPRSVLYIDGELPAITVKERIATVLAGMEDAEPLPGAFRIITPDVQNRPMPDLGTAEGQRLVEDELKGADLLILDNLSALVRTGNEDKGEDWTPIQGWLLDLRRRGIATLFMHHAGKNKEQRGTSKREDLLDVVMTLKHDAKYDPSEGLRCELLFQKTRGMLGDAAKPFEVRLESGQDGRAVWTMRDLSDAKEEHAFGMYDSGLSVRDVAEELGIGKSSAGRMRQKWQGNRGVSHRPTP